MKINRINLAMALAGTYFTRDASNTVLPEFNKEALTRSFTFERFN
jgi:hypothetical protein